MFDAAPIWVGGVYVEADQGTDQTGDSFYITFNGGAANTQLTRLVINTDQNATGIGVADNFFDTVEGGLGADHAFPFHVSQLIAKDPNARVTATVADGSMQLVLNFENFYAGDRLIFSIDVDEVQHFTIGETDLVAINDGIDPITSGVEFQGSTFQASFKAPHYEDIENQSTFTNRYDPQLANSNLQLPADNDGGLRDRSAGTAFTVTQIAKPISIAGVVYADNNINLTKDAGEVGIGNVPLELFRKVGSQYITTGFKTTTDSQGSYRFGLDLKLQPGTYQVRETQPSGYFSVGATPGLLEGSRVGQIVVDNKDILTEITIPNGDTSVTELNFAEAQPTKISGYVYEDVSDDGRRDSSEKGIAGVTVQLIGINTLVPFTTQNVVTNADGSYSFTNLSPGTYRVVELSQPTAYFDGKESPGTVGGIVRGRSTINDQITDILLNGNDVGTEYNFGELPPGSISGHVCIALPGFDCFSSAPNSQEPLPGVKIELIDSQGNVYATTTSAADGTYRFDQLPVGVYSIVETTPSNVIDGDARVGTVGGSSVGATQGTSRIISVELKPGQVGIDYDFCELQPSTLAGNVYEDRNNDGVRQANEPLLPNVEIELFDASGQRVAQVQTDGQGAYSFTFLKPGTYRIVERQPAGYIDGKDQVGTILGQPVGVVDSASDTFSKIVLTSGMHGVNYDFGELRPSSIAGQVRVDTDGNCIIDVPGDGPLAGVLIELLDSDGRVITSVLTNTEGRYRFDNLLPGSYRVRETQPTDYLQGDSHVGSGGGRIDTPDLIVDIAVSSGDVLVDYDFCEIPPATISGYVFQDGPALVTADGKPPVRLRPLRDGVRDPIDAPIAGVVLELRTILGQPFPSANALPGIYSGPTIIVTSDENGYFEFKGLRPGSYHIYQRQPDGYFDGLDTAGTTGGVPLNVEDTISDQDVETLIETLALDDTTRPYSSAILLISVRAGEFSRENNFSEILVNSLPPNPPPPVPPIDRPPTPYNPPPTNGYPSLPFDTMLVGLPPAPTIQPLLIAGGASAEYSWHLSVINSGTPRGTLAGKQINRKDLNRDSSVLDLSTWKLKQADATQWTYVSNDPKSKQILKKQAFDIKGAHPLAGDFNGDGQDEIALFLEGEWLIDINGNGKWDEGDMWAKLGDVDDLPVVGDWDGDGKDDIGIFGPQWEGDDVRLESEPGLPDPENHRLAKPKNLPPDLVDAPIQERLLQRSILGPGRSDVIDHVFRFGIKEDQPVAADFNGDNISSIGIFSRGKWRLDVNGDGLFTQDVDKLFDFGADGDIAVTGDFDGDGIDEVAVIRGSRLIVDSNRNERMDATDLVFELEGSGNAAIVGDFDGDGRDEAALIERILPDRKSTEVNPVSDEVPRQARRAG